jgi:flagellar biosynthesis protein FliQ
MTLTFAPKMIVVFVAASLAASIGGEMVQSPDMMKRRLREGWEFFGFLRERRATAQ